jgi:hypothetical protein
MYYNMDIKNEGTRSHFTMLGRCVAIYMRCGICARFLQQFENTVVLRRTFIHLISISIESHNGDDATKD